MIYGYEGPGCMNECVCVGSEDLIFKIETASPEGGLLKEDHTNDLRAQSNNCGVNNSIMQVFGNNPPQV